MDIFKQLPDVKFNIKDLGKIKYYFGSEITRKFDGNFDTILKN